MKKVMLACLAVLVLAGCNESDNKVISYGQSEISQNLKDPNSGIFRNSFFNKDERMPDDGVSGYVCGEVNAKNAFGAYAGFTPFYIHVTVKTRWLFPALGVLRGSSNPAIISEAGDPEAHLYALKLYASKCGKE